MKTNRWSETFDATIAVGFDGVVVLIEVTQKLQSILTHMGHSSVLAGDELGGFPDAPGRYSVALKMKVTEKPTGTGLLDGILKTTEGDAMVEVEAVVEWRCLMHKC